MNDMASYPDDPEPPAKPAKKPKQPAVSEDTIATAFTDRHRDKLRYCHHTGSWFVWTGTRWQREETRLAFCWARDAARDLAGKKMARAAVASGVERFAQADRAFAVTSEIWDTDKFLLGTQAAPCSYPKAYCGQHGRRTTSPA